MISEAVEAYLASLDEPGSREAPPPPIADDAARSDDLDDAWFQTFDEATHARYEDDPPTPLGRLGAWLSRAATRASS